MKNSDLIDRTRQYTAQHRELQQSHHFLLDLRLEPGNSDVDFVVVGRLPGESDEDWKLATGPTEESSDYDFHEGFGASKGSRDWKNLVNFFCGSNAGAVTQMFFWSCSNTHEAFVSRFGVKYIKSPHLDFCRDLNIQLIKRLKPRFVVVPGLENSSRLAKLYGLEVKEMHLAENGHRLIEHYERDQLPWIFTKQWRGSFGFSQAQRETIKDYLANL